MALMSISPANFVIIFDEKEGTTALVTLLDKIPGLTIVKMDRGQGLESTEPFNLHNCGRVSNDDLRFCLNGILGSHPADLEAINTRYSLTAKGTLMGIEHQGARGFKMRLRALALPWYPSHLPRLHHVLTRAVPRVSRKLEDLFQRYNSWSYMKMMTKILKRNHVVVFMAVRQDVFRWALSKYHGDGTGKPGHLQFKLARGELKKDEIGKIYVDPERFKSIVANCEFVHSRKRYLMQKLQREGLDVYSICYEDFVGSAYQTLSRFCRLIRLEVSEDDLQKAVAQGADFQKVHSDNISEFVENHQEMAKLFGDRFVSWK